MPLPLGSLCPPIPYGAPPVVAFAPVLHAVWGLHSLWCPPRCLMVQHAVCAGCNTFTLDDHQALRNFLMRKCNLCKNLSKQLISKALCTGVLLRVSKHEQVSPARLLKLCLFHGPHSDPLPHTTRLLSSAQATRPIECGTASGPARLVLACR